MYNPVDGRQRWGTGPAHRGIGAASDVEAELYGRPAPRVRRYGLQPLRDAQAAADLTQQVLLMTIERLRDGNVHDPDRLGSYVLGMCRLVVLDIRRGSASVTPPIVAQRTRRMEIRRVLLPGALQGGDRTFERGVEAYAVLPVLDFGL